MTTIIVVALILALFLGVLPLGNIAHQLNHNFFPVHDHNLADEHQDLYGAQTNDDNFEIVVDVAHADVPPPHCEDHDDGDDLDDYVHGAVDHVDVGHAFVTVAGQDREH